MSSTGATGVCEAGVVRGCGQLQQLWLVWVWCLWLSLGRVGVAVAGRQLSVNLAHHLGVGTSSKGWGPQPPNGLEQRLHFRYQYNEV